MSASANFLKLKIHAADCDNALQAKQRVDFGNSANRVTVGEESTPVS
jgi:hypothetical protein